MMMRKEMRLHTAILLLRRQRNGFDGISKSILPQQAVDSHTQERRMEDKSPTGIDSPSKKAESHHVVHSGETLPDMSVTLMTSRIKPDGITVWDDTRH